MTAKHVLTCLALLYHSDRRRRAILSPPLIVAVGFNGNGTLDHEDDLRRVTLHDA